MSVLTTTTATAGSTLVGIATSVQSVLAGIPRWNGTSMLFPIKANNPDAHIWSDASGGWGAADWYQGKWFQVRWEDFQQFGGVSIAAKEFLPIVVAAATWGREWTGKTVCFHCDNAAVVSVLRGGYTREQHMAHLLQCLFFIEANLIFFAVSSHVPGAQNTIADALSRNQLPPCPHLQ